MYDSTRHGRDIYRFLLGGWTVARQTSAAPAVVGLGVFCLVYDSWIYPYHGACTEMHALFGMVLIAGAAARFHGGLKQPPVVTPNDIAALSRTLSRRVYLLLYGLFGLKIAMNIGRLHPEPATSFRDYLLYGIVALVVVRVMAVRQLRRAQFTPIARAATGPSGVGPAPRAESR
jgi:hypothetical protein